MQADIPVRRKVHQRKMQGNQAREQRQERNRHQRSVQCLWQRLSDAFAEQDKQSEELALVLVVPAPVQEATSALKRNKARPQNGYGTDGSLQYRAEGYADGKRFDPTTKLENKGSA